MSRVSKSAVLALATAVCAVIIAVPAQAKTEQIKSGQTTVKLSPLVKALLAKTGLTVTPVGPAKVGGGSLSMPMSSGPMSVPSMNGKMNSKGGLRFRFGDADAGDPRLQDQPPRQDATVSAIVHGKRITLARITHIRPRCRAGTAR